MSLVSEFFGEAEFEVEGKIYTLTLNMRAILGAERVLGQSMLIWLPKLQADFALGRTCEIGLITAIIYAGIRGQHPEVSEEWVISVALGERGEDAQRAMQEALMEAAQGIDVPEDKLGNSPIQPNRAQKRAAKAGAGMKSSNSGAKRAINR